MVKCANATTAFHIKPSVIFNTMSIITIINNVIHLTILWMNVYIYKVIKGLSIAPKYTVIKLFDF